MRYCQRCILPDTRPGLVIYEDGECNACKNSKSKKAAVDWASREEAFRSVAENAKRRSTGYDCLIPVSGGKDSTWQVVKCLEYGLNPLAMTWKTPARSEIGQKNLDNLVSLGVDHIDYQVSPRVEKKFLVKAFERFGATAIPMHMAMFSMPLRLAVKLDIPLIVWGENSAFEYGSNDESLTGFKLDRAWLKAFGVTHGTTAEDWICEELTQKELTPYFCPTDSELEAKQINAIFLGYYLQWDVETSLKVAQEHGFRVRKEGPKTGYYNYADIDDDFISLHHYIKWFKFGITRTWDNLSLEIRNGRMTRSEAIEFIRQRGDETPWEDIQKFCAFTGMTEKRFFQIAESFRNRDIWKLENGIWNMENFLIPDWNWK